jgi:polysaccharide export outer membrane protein
MRISALSLFLVLFLPCASSSAQKPVLLDRQPVAVTEYVLGPGDQVSIHVDDLEEISDRPIRIDPNGFIDLPLVGRIEAGGLTIDKLRSVLASKLTKYISSPQTSINLIENKARAVSVIGSVNNPGVHPLEGPQHLIEAISQAGGIRNDAGSRVIIVRQARWGQLPFTSATTDATGSFSTATISLRDLLSAENPTLNILVDPGDVISVPKADVVYVLGTVRRAGGFALESKDSLSLLQTLSLAQGLDLNAALSRARILRKPLNGDGPAKEIPVDISKIISGKQPDVPLFANDVLYIPSSVIKATARRSTEAMLAIATGLVIYH